MKTEHIYIIGIIFILIGGGTLWYRSIANTAAHSPVPPEVLTSKPTASANVIIQDSSSDLIKTNILSYLDKKTPGMLTSMMTEKVTFTRFGTQCCGVIGKDQTVPQFAALQPAQGPWTMDETNEKIVRLKKQDLLDNKMIAITENGYAVGFHVTSTDLIDEVVIIENYAPLLE